MGHFFSFMRNARAHKDELSGESVKTVHGIIKFVQESLGLISLDPEKVLAELDKHNMDLSDTGVEAKWIEALIQERKEAKASKKWGRADEIRKELNAKNIVLKDNPDGSTSWSVQS
jgi:cysteinyl-tRNA synthetase